MEFDNLWLTRHLEKDTLVYNDAFPFSGSFKEQRTFLKDHRMLYPSAHSLSKKYDTIGVFSEVPIFDAGQAVHTYHALYPQENHDSFRSLVSLGIAQIVSHYNYQEFKFMIVVKNTGDRIPIDVGVDEEIFLETGLLKLVGFIPTVISKADLNEKYLAIHELNIEGVFGVVNMVDNSLEYFNVYNQSDKVFAEFLDVVV